MEHKQAMGLEELEKRQQDLKEKMHQITEMMTSLMKERGVVESPNFQEESVQEKSDNQKGGIQVGLNLSLIMPRYPL